MVGCRRCHGVILLFDFPEPRRIASRPLACRASTIADGAAVPSMDTSCSLRLAVILLIPAFCQANDVHRARPRARTTQIAERPFDVFDAGLTGHGHCESGFERRHSHRDIRVSARDLVYEVCIKLRDRCALVPTFALKCNVPSARTGSSDRRARSDNGRSRAVALEIVERQASQYRTSRIPQPKASPASTRSPVNPPIERFLLPSNTFDGRRSTT